MLPGISLAAFFVVRPSLAGQYYFGQALRFLSEIFFNPIPLHRLQLCVINKTMQ